MRKVIATVFAVAAAATMLALASVAVADNGTAVITVSFHDNSATITSTKAISHYRVELCDGRIVRVDQVSGQFTTLNIGPFGSAIVNVLAKSAETIVTVESGVDCDHDGDHDGDDHHDGTHDGTHH